jgi:translation initiation factor 1
MARGTKLDLNIGANLGEGWAMVDEVEEQAIVEVLPPEKHQLYFKREKRRGKVVTLVGPFMIKENTMKALIKQLKKKLGTGGTVEKPFLAFQGEPAKLRELLETQNYRFKK